MNCPGLTPLAPRAGPIGGAGVALPPGAWSLNWLVISFLAIVVYPPVVRRTFPSLGNHSLDDRHVDLLTSGAGRVLRRRGKPENVGESGRLLLLNWGR